MRIHPSNEINARLLLEALLDEGLGPQFPKKADFNGTEFYNLFEGNCRK